MDERPGQEGRAAPVVAGLGFFYAVLVTAVLLPLEDFFRDDPNREAVLLWLTVPLSASFLTWMAVLSRFPPLRAWIWFGAAVTLFFCWIAVFSFGLFYLPVAALMLVAAISPWQRPPSPQHVQGRRRAAPEAPRAVEADGWLWVSPAARHGREVGYLRRLFGDALLEEALFAVTLGVGWLVWFAVESRRGQTPAKRLLSVKVHDMGSGEVASAGKLWLREIVAKRAVPAAIAVAAVSASGLVAAAVAAGAYTLAGAMLALISAERRALWDYLSGTTVRLHD